MNRTPDMTSVLKQLISRSLSQTWTMLPGKIVEWFPESQKATVQPLLKLSVPGATSANEGDLIESLPIMQDVPVMLVRSYNSFLHIPIYAGTNVMLLFSSRSLEKWLVSDGREQVDVQDTRKHDLSDAVAVIGMYPFENPVPLRRHDQQFKFRQRSGGEVELVFFDADGSAALIPSPTGKVQLGAEEGDEPAVLGDTIKQLLNDVWESFVVNAPNIVTTGVGPGALNPDVLFVVQELLLSLETILATKVRLT